MFFQQPRTKESLEVRRAKGEISCAECRRQKLKCNRAIPCSTCVRKGCQAICPNGTLDPGQGGRANSAEMVALLQKVAQMKTRIQELEEALQVSKSSETSTPLPLLTEGSSRTKLLTKQSPNVSDENEVSEEDTIDSFGTLATLDRGIETYVGTDRSVIDRFGSAEVMFLKLDPKVLSAPPYPSESFPFTPLNLPTHEMQVLIEEKLPSIGRATALVEAYLENMSWLIRIVDREQIMEELIPHVYRRQRIGSNEKSLANPHMLCLLLAVFACGAVADLTLSPWNEEAKLYFHLAWTAISLKPVFDGASVYAVQALALLGTYDLFSCEKTSLESSWKMTGFCTTLASSLGLHRDPSHFKLPPKIIQRRRQVFWELYGLDAWKTIGSGRPLIFHPQSIDCELPEDKDAIITEDGTRIPSYWGITYRFTKEIMVNVAEKLSCARTLRYSEIMALDQKIRDFDPEHVANLTANASQDGGVRHLLSKFLLCLLIDGTQLLLHRTFFVRALVENPTNPMQSRFAPSFWCTYRSAIMLLRAIRELLDACAHFVVRVWPILAHFLSASVMLGTVASCGTLSALAPQAYVEFNLAIDMLTKIQMHPLVKEVLPLLYQLRNQAYQALTKNGHNVPYYPPPMLSRAPATENEQFNRVPGSGGAIRNDVGGHFGDSPRSLSKFMDKPSRSSSPSSTGHRSSPSSENIHGPGTFRNQGITEPMASLKLPQNEGSKNTEGGAFPRGVNQSTSASFPTAYTMDARAEPLRPSTRGDHRYPEPMQVNLERVTPLASSHASTLDRSGNEPDFNSLLAALPGQDSRYGSRLSTAQNAYHGANNSRLASNAEHAEIGHNQAFNFESLPTFTPETLFNADFDINFNMRSSVGDENLVPLMSEDLAPWRSILQDPRFFGNDTIMLDNETHAGPS